jgi:S1-C subfamily serine protease
MVLSVVPDSAAARAGVVGARSDPDTGRVLLGDLIVGLDDVAIEGVQDLHVALDQKRPGDRVTLVLRKDEAERKVELTLGASVQ